MRKEKIFCQKLKTFPFPLVTEYLFHLYGMSEPIGNTITYGKEIELTVSEKNTKIELVNCKVFKTENLDSIIEALEEAINNSEEKVRTVYIFSYIKFEGHFKYKDEFQLFEMPNKDLQCPQILNCQHPFVFQYKTVSYGKFPYNYESKDIKEYLLLLNIFSFFPISEFNDGMSWVRNENSNKIESVHTSFYDNSFTQNEFLNIDSLAPLPVKEYDGMTSFTDTFYLPFYFTKMYEKYSELPANKKEIFLISSHWIKNSNVKGISSSQRYVSLLNAIEALLPTQKKIGICNSCNTHIYDRSITKSFHEFMDKYSPNNEKKLLKRLYKIRSELTHGSKILAQDNPISSFFYTPQRSQDERELRDLRLLTKYAIHNWIFDQ